MSASDSDRPASDAQRAVRDDSTEKPRTGAKSSPSGSTQGNMKATMAAQDAKVKTDHPEASSQKKKSKRPAAAAAKKVSRLGDFKLIKKLGRGGMGEVYLANHTSLDRRVAVKVLSKEMAKKKNFVERFQREAKAMARLDHNNVVKVYAVDFDKSASLHYVAIEYIDGQSLQDWMDSLGKIEIGDALHVILRVCDALREAHSQTLIHRDIKPDNILLTKDGIVKVADFGLAKATSDDDMSMTQSGTGLGTPLYMPPEQARDAKTVDLRTDVYAIGTTLYYFLTGALPFMGDNMLKLIMAKEKGTFKPVRDLEKSVPEKLSLMVDKMLAKNPDHRYADCDEIINDLTSLDLENESLSFVGEGAKAVSKTAGTKSRSKTPSQIRSGTAVSSSKDAQRTEAKQYASRKDKELFVQFSNAKGKVTISKMTMVQIQQAIRSEMFDVRAKAKRGMKGEFMPLAQFPEFAELMKRRLVKAQTSARSSNMRDMYAKIEKEVTSRKRWRWFKRTAEGAMGGFGFVVYLLTIAAVLYGLYLVVPMGYEWLKTKLENP